MFQQNMTALRADAWFAAQPLRDDCARANHRHRLGLNPMNAPLPPDVEAVDNVFERTAAAIEALQAHKPKTKAEERRRAALNWLGLGKRSSAWPSRRFQKTRRSASRRLSATTISDAPQFASEW